MSIPNVVVQDLSHHVENVNYYSNSCKKDYFDTWAEMFKKRVHPHSCNMVNPAHPETEQNHQVITLTALFLESSCNLKRFTWKDSELLLTAASWRAQMVSFQNRHLKWRNKDWFPVLLKLCFKFSTNSHPIFRFWCYIYIYKEYKFLFCMSAWECNTPTIPSKFFFQKVFSAPAILLQSLAFCFLVHFVFILYICVFAAFLSTLGNCFSFFICQRHMVQLLFKTMISLAPVFYRLLQFFFQLPGMIRDQMIFCLQNYFFFKPSHQWNSTQLHTQ